MWTRSELKNQAKDFLRQFYLQAFIVALLIALVTGVGGNNGSKGQSQIRFDGDFNPMNFEMPMMWNNFDENFSEDINENLGENFGTDLSNRTAGLARTLLPLWVGLALGIGSLIAFFAFIFAIGVKIFVGAPLEVGGRAFFVRGAVDQAVNFGDVGMAFRRDHYLNVVWVMFYRGILNFLFYLLLIVPGIIKNYSYSMVPYLLAEDPTLDAKTAIQLSEEMTEGHKLNMFILDLSFIGWYFLGLLLFGLGKYLVNPYVYATKAQLYLTLRPERLDF